jgi:hypothetical protein
VFPKLILAGVSRFYFQSMSLGHKYPSWLALPSYLKFSMLLQCLHPQLLMFPLSLLPLPALCCSSLYLLIPKSNECTISKEIARLSNRISDLPEEICISSFNKGTLNCKYISSKNMKINTTYLNK